MRVPSVRDLGDAERAAVIEAAQRLREGGFRCWIVGGAVRDLALGETPKDVDVASAAPPSTVEELFARTHAVGRAFGTLIVPIGALELQHTTFRMESSYSDARRPDRIEYGTSLLEDARRRDFTCNAIYLDPLTDELRDPVGGWKDLECRRLACVGAPRERFAEDGLRLLRLGRFSGRYGLDVGAGLLADARAARDSLVGVSPERVRNELERCLEAPGTHRAFEVFADIAILDTALALPAKDTADGLALLRSAPDAPGATLGWALLLGAGTESARSALGALRPSRARQRAVEACWEAAAELEALLDAEHSLGTNLRARRIRLVRRAGWPEALGLARARRVLAGRACAELDELEAFRDGLTAAELSPEPLIGADDLRTAGVPAGPAWGRLLAAAEDAQLAGELSSRSQVAAWIAEALRTPGSQAPGT